MESSIVEASAEEIAYLAAEDNNFYCHHFFPKAFRQPSAKFHKQIWDALETPGQRYVACEIFRDGAKTTLLRAFASKRVSYASSRVILYVSETQDHAKRSVRWLRRYVAYNKPWAGFFKLSFGSKKTDEWLEIYNGIDDVFITLLALGMTGQTRGINLDDFRPDLIVVDDPCNEENTATPEQRKKTRDIFFGALQNSLAPPTESEDAKMVLLQTSLQKDDLINECHSDDAWKTFKFSCFDENEESTWPERWPTDFLRGEKAAARKKNRLVLWYREKECKIVAAETADFRSSWLKELPGGLLPDGGVNFLYIDPVPPPSERELAQGLKEKDYEAFAVVKFYKGKYFLCETKVNKGHNPDWSIMTFWYMVERWNIFMYEVESTAYQRTLRWLLEQSMRERGRYIQVHAPAKADKRNKRVKIIDSLSGPTSSGNFYLNFEENPEFVDQYTAYPNVNHEDALEAVAGATKLAREHGPLMDAGWEEGVVIDGEFHEKVAQRALGYCP